MNRTTRQIKIWSISAALVLSNAILLGGWAQAQERSRSRSPGYQTNVAYDRGYADGYEDGYREGRSDYDRDVRRDHQRSRLWQESDRGYESRFGSLADYREAYRVGFEVAYTDGYYNRAYSPKTPRNAMATRGGAMRARDRERFRAGSLIPDGTELRLRLMTALSTRTNREGDRFTAQVIEPRAYEGATVEGHVARIERSGRMSGHAEMALEFDTITLREGRSSPLYAEIEKIYASDSIKTMDREGNIESASKTKDVVIRSAGGAALGAIIGGIAKGGKGAAIGAIIGAGVGAGSVFIQGEKDLILDAGAEMSVRTTVLQREKTRS
ncbi:MAG TPA: hypothetical protein VFD58_24055 [Blastocatellia bacterium]|nr:hypothetical protein [Blastocatellia bacterium]